MSAPSSPASSSPGGSSPALMLTPQSKIRALLATVESSDEEAGASTPTGSKYARRDALARLDEGDASEVSDEDEIRPRGRLAGRMQAAAKNDAEKERRNARQGVNEGLRGELAEGKLRQEDQEDDDLPPVPRQSQHPGTSETTPGRDTARQDSNRSSPGLFVSSPIRPPSARSTLQNELSGSDSDDLPAISSDRFRALVEKKRQERLAREAKERAEREERRARQEQLASELDELDSNDDDVADISDDEGGLTLTQKSARPSSRKASKKAIEEMNRETQRMVRSMQLAPEVKTRKKITKSSLFEKFNFRPDGQPAPATVPQPNSSSRPATPQSDAEKVSAGTPPSSPPSAVKPSTDKPSADKTLHVAPSKSIELVNKGKFTAIEVSDDELEIIDTAQDKLSALFDSAIVKAAPETRSRQVLRSLASARSSGKKQTRQRNNQTAMTYPELQTSLLQKIKQQVKQERLRKQNILKSKGIVVQSMEERERQLEEVEDIVAKARENDQRLQEQERDAAKKDRKEDAAADPLAWDDSDDEYLASDKEESNLQAIELSGSEDEEASDADDESDVAANPIFDEEAEDSEEEQESKAQEDDDMEDVMMQSENNQQSQNSTAMLSEDGNLSVIATPKPIRPADHAIAASGDSPAAPSSVLRSAKKTFIPGLPVNGPAGLGLTQIFAGTMENSQCGNVDGPTPSMMPDFDHFPDSNFSATMDPPAANLIEDSQLPETQAATQGIRLDMSQSQMRGLDSLLRDDFPGDSQNFELTQDVGLQTHTPLKNRFVDPPFSTIATEVAGTMEEDAPHLSPLGRGKLRLTADTEKTTEPTQQATAIVPTPAQDVFAAMKEQAQQKRQRRLTHEFNAKTSKAKEMVEQEAEESDDEYAGLGGIDGEDSDNESDASVKEMIDDAATNDADDGKLAAFYADRARAEDEQQIEKLFKDVTTGMLRRKRGAGYDLSDSDDDGEARKRMKRRQFSKMQKALFSDERVKKIAEDPANLAFFRTIHDQDRDERDCIMEMVDYGSQRESTPDPETQGENDAAQKMIPDSQPQQPGRAALDTSGDNANNSGNRAPARMRRTKNGRKPSNLGEVRETLSSLLGESGTSFVAETEAGSDSEEDGNGAPQYGHDKENRSPRRSTAVGGVVDRISLKRRGASSRSSGRMAFASAASAAGSTTFKVPSLLRRATRNSSMVSTESSTSIATTTSSGAVGSAVAGSGFGGETRIKKVAGRRSGVVGRTVPASEGRARIEENERRREEKKLRGAERRLGLIGGALGRCSFA